MTKRLLIKRLANFQPPYLRGLILLLVLGAFCFLVPSVAMAQGTELKPLLDRLERMERDIRTLNVQISRGGSSGSTSGASDVGGATGSARASEPALARIEVRLSTLDEELRTLTGKMESESHQIDQMNRRLDKLVSDIDFRLSALEKSNSGSSSRPGAGKPGQQIMGTVPPAVPVEQASPGGKQMGTLGTLKKGDLTSRSDGRSGGRPGAPPKSSKQGVTKQPAANPKAIVGGVLPAGSAKDQYAYAFGLLRQAKYQEAETALKAFIAKHTKHPLASNARYWLWESYYVRAQFAEAAKDFYKAYQSNKQGNKAPDSLLKLGMSLSGLKKQAQACAAFNKLTADYPSLQPSVKRKLAAERKRAGCR